MDKGAIFDRIPKLLPYLVIGIIVFAFALFLRVWKLDSAPGIYVDEPFYLDIALNFGKSQVLVSGNPWFTHPPLFFLMQRSFLSLVGINSITFSNIFAARLPSALISATTVFIVFFWIGRSTNIITGVLTSLLLMLEQYYLNFSRTGIMESTVIFFGVFYFFFLWQGAIKNKTIYYLVAGLFFGLALLTKEISVYLLISIFLWVVICYIRKKKIPIRHIFLSITTGLFTYLIYFTYQLSVYGHIFIYAKITDLAKLFSSFNSVSSAPSSSTFWYDITRLASVYLGSYTILILAFLASVYIIIKDKSNIGIFLSSWFFGSLVFRLLIGLENVKFFVYLTVPATIVLGYIAFILAKKSNPNFISFTRKNKLLIGKKSAKKIFYSMAIITTLIFNFQVWYGLYETTTDNAIALSVSWVNAHTAGENQIIGPYYYSYFLRDKTVIDISPNWSDLACPLQEIDNRSIHYIVGTTQWFHELDRLSLDYIAQNGSKIAVFQGQWTQEVVIYYIANPI